MLSALYAFAIIMSKIVFSLGPYENNFPVSLQLPRLKVHEIETQGLRTPGSLTSLYTMGKNHHSNDLPTVHPIHQTGEPTPCQPQPWTLYQELMS